MAPKRKEPPPGVNMNKVASMGTAPRWTIRGRPNDFRASDRAPGPGEYDVGAPDTYWSKKMPSFSIGNAGNYKGRCKQTTPAPTDYTVPTGLRYDVGVTIAEHHKKETRVDREPGPGSYDPPIFARAVKNATIPMKVVPPESRANYPGPGTYEFADQFKDFTRPDQPKHRFPNAERKWILPTGPGPGTYEPVDYMFSRTPICYTFGTKCEEKDDKRNITFTTFSQFC